MISKAPDKSALEDSAEESAAIKRLIDGTRQMEISLSNHQALLMVRFLRLIQKWNRVYNLTAIKALDAMVDLHLLDSLTLLAHLKGASLLDVGTGAGLPGIPLAIARPDLKVTLLDSTGKKVRFVTQAVIDLGLDNVKVVQSRIESFEEGNFDNVVCRAFTRLDDFQALTQRLVAAGGQWLAMKGRKDSLEDSCLDWHLERVQLPFNLDERHLLILEKVLY